MAGVIGYSLIVCATLAYGACTKVFAAVTKIQSLARDSHLPELPEVVVITDNGPSCKENVNAYASYFERRSTVSFCDRYGSQDYDDNDRLNIAMHEVVHTMVLNNGNLGYCLQTRYGWNNGHSLDENDFMYYMYSTTKEITYDSLQEVVDCYSKLPSRKTCLYDETDGTIICEFADIYHTIVKTETTYKITTIHYMFFAVVVTLLFISIIASVYSVYQRK